MSQPSLSDLILPAQPTLNTLLSSLKKTSLSPHNRLRSIQRDAEFVLSVAECYGGRPLVANERCGSWYVEPGRKGGSAYFKSTDGHTGQWGFSCRRLNLHLLEIIEKNDGCIIVDSTRRGKRMPDALSKTIPIWCAVLNAALFPDLPCSHTLHTPPNVVPPTEHAQIAALLPSCLTSLQALNLDLPSLRSSITKPLRPFWVTPDTQLPPPPPEDSPPGPEPIFDDYRPVVCCTASSKASGGEMASFEGYVQGAADDTEHWAMGLTPTLFWAHSALLLFTPEPDLPTLISSLIEEEKRAAQSITPVELTPHIAVCPLPLPEEHRAENECHVVFAPASATPRETWVKGPARMEVGLGNPRQASKNLRTALPDICAFVSRFFQSGGQATGTTGAKDDALRVVIACESGKNISVATALAIQCQFFDDENNFRLPKEEASLNKASIRMKLGRMMIAFPEANPHRATLQSVNSYLMDWRS